ncbi:hypothetical protein [Amycolatopsis sp. NPDC051372]|uniref:hypothetical protein n=1 Tax=Amycolatopsis sp. NPDC051372 TaxID=3155669 RepID=UPI003434B7AA
MAELTAARDLPARGDLLAAMLAAFRADVDSVPFPEFPGHMPTQPTFRVVVPRFPRLAAATRWVTTVGAATAAAGCFAAAAVLTVASELGVRP